MTGIISAIVLATIFYARLSDYFGGGRDWSGIIIFPAIVLTALNVPAGLSLLKKNWPHQLAILPLGLMTTAVIWYLYYEVSGTFQGYYDFFQSLGFPIFVLIASIIIGMDTLYYLGWKRRHIKPL